VSIPLTVLPGDEQLLVLPFSEYGHQLADNSVVRFTTTVQVRETQNTYVDTYDVQVESPKCITIKVKGLLLLCGAYSLWVSNVINSSQ